MILEASSGYGRHLPEFDRMGSAATLRSRRGKTLSCAEPAESILLRGISLPLVRPVSTAFWSGRRPRPLFGRVEDLDRFLVGRSLDDVRFSGRSRTVVRPLADELFSNTVSSNPDVKIVGSKSNLCVGMASSNWNGTKVKMLKPGFRVNAYHELEVW
jgi:hypothetical protein